MVISTEGLRELSLFSGVGGGILGGQLLGWNTVCYVENNAYCVEVLKARIGEGYLCDAPIWGDIKTFDGKPWRGSVDIITAGFPCQPFSVAGKRKGADDSRNMWPQTIRVIREVRPRYALCENVPGLISGDHGYFGRILNDLSQSGYDARWRIVSAADVGAPHLRKRLWIYAERGDLSHAEHIGSRRVGESEQRRECEEMAWIEQSRGDGSCEMVADAQSCGKVPAEQQGQRNGFVQEGQDMADARCRDAQQRRQSVSEATERGNSRSRRPAATGSAGGSGYEGGNVPDSQGAEGGRVLKREIPPDAGTGGEWWGSDPADAENAVESGMGRVANGIPCRVDRLKAIGNAQVPGVAKLAWELLKGR